MLLMHSAPAGRFPGPLNGRQQHGGQNGDDGDDDKQFDQSKTAAIARRRDNPSRTKRVHRDLLSQERTYRVYRC